MKCMNPGVRTDTRPDARPNVRTFVPLLCRIPPSTGSSTPVM